METIHENTGTPTHSCNYLTIQSCGRSPMCKILQIRDQKLWVMFASTIRIKKQCDLRDFWPWHDCCHGHAGLRWQTGYRNSDHHFVQLWGAKKHLRMHNMSNFEADGVQPQKTMSGSTSVKWSHECQFLLRCTDGRLRIWHQQHGSMDQTCLVSTGQAGGGGVLVWGMFSRHTFATQISINAQTLWVSLLTLCASSWPQFIHLLMASSSIIMHHDTKQKSSQSPGSWTWQWRRCSSVAFPGTFPIIQLNTFAMG